MIHKHTPGKPCTQRRPHDRRLSMDGDNTLLLQLVNFHDMSLLQFLFHIVPLRCLYRTLLREHMHFPRVAVLPRCRDRRPVVERDRC